MNKMTHITLAGSSLGERHRYLNIAVNEAYRSIQDSGSFQSIPEQTPVDRIFKISVASKLSDTEYILRNLKDDDMLYVSKALKCKWLLKSEYEHIINPEYLEDCLYPFMITTAVTKMKHWMLINLKDQKRCHRFFLYYCGTNFKLAVKFLRNCSADVIKEEYSKHMHKMSPKDFKILCEKNPLVAKDFFDNLLTDEDLKEKYLLNEKQYFTTLKSLLKTSGTMALDITEKYFNKQTINAFSSKATKLIMKQHRKRFIQKPELYTAFLLNMKSLASCLNSKEATDLTLTLAKDNYLLSEKWFNFKNVEPLVKRIKAEERGIIKQQIFVNKNVGEIVLNWPYETPSSPIRATKVLSIFEDYEYDPDNYNRLDFKSMLKKRKYAKWAQCESAKTMLDKLFDEYRVASYNKTLFELQKKIKAESSAQNRQYMMLVLISKSDGHESNVASLMQLLSEYKNEPPQLRAAVVRSLVKRARVWRAPYDTWKQLLEFSHGLGLDGKQSEVACTEGIHAVAIRQILADGTCDPQILSSYLINFSTFEEYSLANNEKVIISDVLPKILYAQICEKSDVGCTESILNKLLDILTAFRLSIEHYPGLISQIKSLARTNILQFSGILNRLFRTRIARRELFNVNFAIIQTEASYLNALRHNVDVISILNLVKLIITKNKSSYQKFFKKISIYFTEEGGLAKQFLDVLKAEPRHIILAKPLALLLGDELTLYVKNIDSSIVNTEDRLFAAALRANVHLSRPALNIDTFGWSAIGTKAVANKVVVCRNTEVNDYFRQLLQNKQTVKLAYLVSKRSTKSNYFYCFNVLSKVKPTAALKLGLQILIRGMSKLSADQVNIWDIIKPLIENSHINFNSSNYLKLPDVSRMPVSIRPAYSVMCYKIYSGFPKSLPLLCHIENLLPNIPEEFIDNILVEYLQKDLPDVFEEYWEEFDVDYNCLYIRLIVKYMLLCKTELNQKSRYELFGAKLFDKMETWFHSDKKKKRCREYFHEILAALQYHKVYLSAEYVSCMPVMTKMLTWMKQHIPIEQNFAIFVHMHLIMLYYIAIRKSINILPNHCIDDNNQMEARRLVGYIFGKYISQEINTLTQAYFISVQYLYKDIILSLHKYFLHSCEIFTKSLIYGLLDQSEGTHNVLAVYLFKERRHCLGAASIEHILLRLRKCENIEMQMIFFAETFSQI